MMYGMIEAGKYAIFKEIVSSLIHDLKNPLSAITLGLEYIQMNTDGRVPPDAIGGAMASAARIDQLLDVLSLYFQDDDTPATAVPLSHVLGKARLLVGYYYSRRHIKLTVSEGASDRSVLLNFNRAFQGLVLLLVGLAKQAAAATAITVSIDDQDGRQTMRLDIEPITDGSSCGTQAAAAPDGQVEPCFDMARSLFQATGIELTLPASWDAPASVILQTRADGAAAAGK